MNSLDAGPVLFQPGSVRRILLPFLSFLPAIVGAADLGPAIELYQSRRYAEAQAAFAGVLAAEPDNATAHYHVGLLALRRGDVAGAVGSLERAVQIDPTSARFFNALGDAYGVSAQKAGMFSKLGFAKKCLAAYERAVALAPDDPGFKISLLNFYAQAPGFAGGSMDKAYALADDVERRDRFRGRFLRASLASQERKWTEALRLVRELQAEFPGRPELDYHLGRIAALSGESLDEGASALQRYLQTDVREGQPSRAQAWVRLGEVEERRGNKAAAQSAFEQALQLAPDSRAAREGLERLK